MMKRRLKTVGQLQEQILAQGGLKLLSQQGSLIKTRRNTQLDEYGIKVDNYERAPETGALRFTDYLRKGIESGASKCAAIYGLLDPLESTQAVCEGNKIKVVSPVEVLSYLKLLTAPSILWRTFLQEKCIDGWGDVLPGTRLPDGNIEARRTIDPVNTTTIFGIP